MENNKTKISESLPYQISATSDGTVNGPLTALLWVSAAQNDSCTTTFNESPIMNLKKKQFNGSGSGTVPEHRLDRQLKYT
jgi:hypothetical protein